ncbi:tRNA splicing endonuclease subunit 54 [Arctopsyche grandis]|uniref:tRNA splicing endonuclease subunit 54 n=1 Tax=Arctopsyche grandis TaxID=121162 RepID=UPI00406D7C1D
MSSSHLLTGKELVENGAKKNSIALPGKGQKQIIASGSWLEKKQIENGLDVKKGLLQDQRIEKRNILSHADWIEELQKAIVTERKGPHWIQLGHVQDNNLYILPEETLYLMEINALFLKYGGVPVSIQQAYNLLLGKSVSLTEYRVYSALSKEGYKLMRHDDNRIYSDSVAEKFPDKGCPLKTKLSNSEDVKEPTQEINTNLNNGLSDKELTQEMTTNPNNGLSTKVPNLVSKQLPVASLNDDESVLNDESNNLTESNNLNQSVGPTITKSDDSDDCMVIHIDVENRNDNNEMKRKRVDDVDCNTKRMALEQIENASDIIEVEDLPIFNRLNILDTIVNCYKRNIIIVPAPKSVFIPSRISLLKKIYVVNLEKVSQAVKNLSAPQFVNNYIGNSDSNVINTIQRFGGNSRYSNNHRGDVYQHNNHFLNNTLFFNHIYQQISIRHFNCNMHFERFSCFGNFINMNFHDEFVFPRFQNQFNTPRLFHPFLSNRNLMYQNHNVNPDSQNLVSQSNRRPSTLNPNPFSAAFHRRRHKKNRRSSQGTHQVKPTEPVETAVESNETIPDSTSSPNSSDEKYTCLLLKAKNILPQCDFNTVRQNDAVRNTLVDIIVKYNSYFDSNYVLNDNLKRNKSINDNVVLPSVESTLEDHVDNERVVQLSSDSELSIDSVSEPVTYDKNSKKPGRSNYVSGQSVSCSHTVSSSDDSDNDRVQNQTNVEAIVSENVMNSTEKDKMNTIFGGWYKENSWNKPEITSLKPKRNFQILKLTTAFLNSVKKFSRDRESNVQSWKQAKQLYDTKNLQDAVAISDDDDMTSSDIRLPTDLVNNDVTIKIDKVEPLIRPQDCKCVQSVLKKLQIVKPYTIDGSTSSLCREEIKILYDVYMPTHKNLKKSSPPSPAYCVIVYSHQTPIPSAEKLDLIRLNIPKNVKILFAVVSFDSVFFLQMENVQLPII